MSWGYYRTQNNGLSSSTVYLLVHLGMVLSSSAAWCIFPKAVLLKKVSFVRKDRQTDRRTDGQKDRRTDKHPQPCSENKPFGEPSVASRQQETMGLCQGFNVKYTHALGRGRRGLHIRVKDFRN